MLNAQDKAKMKLPLDMINKNKKIKFLKQAMLFAYRFMQYKL